MKTPRVVIRADASPLIGGGHVMRCLSLAEALAKRGADITFACATILPFLAERMSEAGYRLQPVEPVPELLADSTAWDSAILSEQAQRRDAERTVADGAAPDWVIVDHYRLDAAWLDALGPGPRRLVIDDLANRAQPCDILVDQTLGRRRGDYEGLVPADCTRLMGAHFALLRSEFASARPSALMRRETPRPLRRLLISLGSTDVGGITARALRAVQAAGLSLEIDVVLGPGAPSLDAVRAAAAQDPNIRLHVDSRDLVGLIAGADLALGAAGTSSWERCCLALPTITLALADNQRLVAAELGKAGAVIVAEGVSEIPAILSALAEDAGARMRLTAAAAAVTEGAGSELVAEAMTGSPAGRGSLEIRLAREGDSRAAWLWRNDPETRSVSRTHHPIAWPDHAAWWGRAVSAPDKEILIVEAGGGPVGLVRFDRLAGSDAWEVGINLRPSARGGGLGGAALAAACEAFFNRHGPAPLMASIRSDNVPSRRIFERLGFLREGPLGGDGFDHYVRPGGSDA